MKIPRWAKFAIIPVILMGAITAMMLAGYPYNCAIVGEDWCNSIEAESLFQSQKGLSEDQRFEKMVFHCSNISNGAKRNKCFYFAATIADELNMITACNQVFDDWGKSTEECINNHGYLVR